MAQKKTRLFGGVATLITYELDDSALQSDLKVKIFPEKACVEWLMFVDANRDRKAIASIHDFAGRGRGTLRAKSCVFVRVDAAKKHYRVAIIKGISKEGEQVAPFRFLYGMGVPAVRVYPLFLFLRQGTGNWGKCDVFHNFIWGNVREYEYNV